MKNKEVGKKFGTIFSIIAALVVAVVFWLFVEYIDRNTTEAPDTAYVCKLPDVEVI